MKSIIIAVIVMFLLLGCSQNQDSVAQNQEQQTNGVTTDVAKPSEEQISPNEKITQPDENQKTDSITRTVETDNVTITTTTSSSGTSSVVEVKNTPVANLEEKPLSEWCIAGQKYGLTQDGGSVDSTIVGISQFKGSQWCKGEQVTVINSPVGEMRVSTTYYFTYGGKKMWVVTNTAGQTNEVYIENK